jgi:hypothetical protein
VLHLLSLRHPSCQVVRVSLNGQDYTPAHPHFGSPRRPLAGYKYHQPDFTFYNVSDIRFSTISPAFGPLIGGTPVDLTGYGFEAYGGAPLMWKKAGQRPPAQAAGWPRLAEARGSLGRDLALRGSSPESQPAEA